jgi:tetratricopeptide (TPR) repeat protein
MAKAASKAKKATGTTLSKEGLGAYANWEIELAVAKLNSAIDAQPDVADHHLNLARALARGGDFDQALRALAEFLRLEPDSDVADRFMQLFGSGLDEVEAVLTDRMSQAGMPIELTGAAIQMWLEYRITIGRKRLVVRKPESWAAALDYAVRKVNLNPATLGELADAYGISEKTLQEKFNSLVNELDVMPCDYRYFAGDENPLDKLVEAAELLDGLEARFREP